MEKGVASENRQILEEAAAWFVEFRLCGMELDRASRLQFMAWIQRSPEHVRAYVEVAGIYVGLPKSGTINEEDVDRLIERLRERERRTSAVPVRPVPARVANDREKRTINRRWQLVVACVTSLAVITLVASIALSRLGLYTTGVAEQQLLTLEDGSILELNARTQLKVRFTSRERRIDLLTGQALFRVAKDRQRPFIVDSGEAQVRAVGTEFDVHLRRSGTTVTVLEGSVAVRRMRAPGASVDPANSADAAGLQLAAGQQLVITDAAVLQPPAPRIAAATAWTNGTLEFDETPLVDAVEDVNRYSRIPFILEGEPPDDLRISGVYSSQDTGSFVRFLRSQADLVVTETDSDVRIRRK
jgi:transmembrane sensor